MIAVGYDALLSDVHDTTVTCRIDLVAGELQAEVQVSGRTGELVGRRAISSTDLSCAELAEAVERVVQMLGQALAGYGLEDDERIHAARTLRSAFHGFAHLEAGDGHPFALDLDDSFDRMVVLLCAGIRQMATVSA